MLDVEGERLEQLTHDHVESSCTSTDVASSAEKRPGKEKGTERVNIST